MSRASVFPLRDARIQDLLTTVAEPETPEDRDAAWEEIARRDARYQVYSRQLVDSQGSTYRDLERVYEI